MTNSEFAFAIRHSQFEIRNSLLMSDPLFTVIILAAFLIALALVHFFKTLDADLWHAWRNPVAAGLVIGIALRAAAAGPAPCRPASAASPRCRGGWRRRCWRRRRSPWRSSSWRLRRSRRSAAR